MKAKHLFEILTPVILSLMISLPIRAQNQDNFYTICNQWDTYYQSHPELKDSAESEYLDYIRWKHFWKDRVRSSDSTKKGSFNLLRDALDDYQNNYRYYHRLTNQYSDWRFLGPQGFDKNYQNDGLISAVYVDTINDPSLNTIYVGTSTAGIWKTIDGGANWFNVTDNSNYSIIGINDICGDPTDGDIIYAATGGGLMDRSHGYGIGILKSPDRGVTWSRIYPDPMWQNPSTALNVYKIKIDPTNSQRIYALADTMVVRSLDGGISWQKIFGTTKCPFDPRYLANCLYLKDIEMKPDDPSVLYVGSDHRTIYNNHQAQVWKLWNVNDTALGNIRSQRLDKFFPRFEFVSDTLHSIYTEQYAIAVTPTDPEAIFIACTAFPYNDATNPQLTIFKYENNQWVRKFRYNCNDTYGPFGGCGYNKLQLLVSPTDTTIVYVGGNTFDKLVNWVDVTHTSYYFNGQNGYHPDTRFAVILQGTASPNTNGINDVIFAGNDGGISKTVNGIQSWINLDGPGLYITQFYGIGGANKNPDWIGGGSQDNSFFKLGLFRWEHTGSGDMGDAIINPSNPQRIYSTTWGGGNILLYSSNDYGSNWASIFSNPTDVYNINAPVCLNPKNPSKIYIATDNLYRSTDGGQSFIRKVNPDTNNLPNQSARAMTIATSDTQRIFIAYDQPDWYFTQSKLFSSPDGGTTWIHLNDIIPAITDFGITNIEVSPTNADSILVSLGGFMSQWSPKSRVLLSVDGGHNWKDYSKGLPNMPVNCLKYKNGSQGGIFAGTDVGVFYIDRTFSDTTWVPLNVNLPQCIVTDIEYIDTLNVLRIATYGRGIWETDLYPCTYHENDPLIVNSNQTWVVDTIMDRDIDIKSPAVFRIQCKVKFPAGSKITVEQGAQLIVDGGILTNYCSRMWLGIEVWGDTSHDQNTSYQGSASFINGAIIENARIAVTACKKDANGDIIWSTPGGKVNASNSTFKNNYKALEFLEYHHSQNCSFSNVDFITSGIFVDHVSRLSDFVSIFKAYGVHFYGCRFKNLNLAGNGVASDSGYLNGRGIYSIDGSYNVDKLCISQQLPCSQWIPSEFFGLFYGIKALGTMPVYPIYIQYSKFNRDRRGIYISGINNISIERDTFEFNPRFYFQYHGADTLYGLYLDNCTGFSVQENKMFRDQNTNKAYIGMIVNNSGTEANEIYNNQISGVWYAILAQQQNRNSNGQSGLCLICNH